MARFSDFNVHTDPPRDHIHRLARVYIRLVTSWARTDHTSPHYRPLADKMREVGDRYDAITHTASTI